MFEISKEFAFSAAHHLAHLPEGHKCAREHGHNYVVRLHLRSGGLSPVDGFVRDYGDLSEFKRWVDQVLDHRDLNEVIPGLIVKHADRLTDHAGAPLWNDNRDTRWLTAESLAWLIYWIWYPELVGIYRVDVEETPKVRASFVNQGGRMLP